MIKKAIIVANGFPPKKMLIHSLRISDYNFIIAADGGANNLMKINLLPDLVIGDFDSVFPETLKRMNKVNRIKLKRQNDTDVEKAIKYLIRKKYNKVVIIGGTGDRLDHSIANLSFVVKYFDKINLLLIHMNSVLFPIAGYNEISVNRGETISLYSFNPGTKISSSGLKYRLNQTSLMFGVKDSTSNVAVSDKIILNVQNGVAFLIRDLQKVIANGNI
jgi:thiamine pyrophosphokinase